MDTFWTVLLSVVGVVVFALIGLGLLIFILRKKRPTSRPTTTNTPNSWSPQKTIRALKPHVSGTFGLCAAVLVLGSAGLVYTYSGAIWYVLWLLPVLLVLTFLIIKASEIKSFPGRVLIIGALVVGAILFIGPHLPGSTPAQPIPYTTNQMAELREMRRACPGGKHEYNYLTTFQPVNPNGWCLTTFWHKGHCIYVRDERRTEHGPYCDLQGGAQIRLPMNIREVRSAQGAFVGFLERKPDYKMLSFYYSPE